MRIKRVSLQATGKWFGLAILCVGVASCTTTTGGKKKTVKSKEYFSESEYGVKASPRVINGKKVPKGGGRYMVGRPYVVKGKRYTPRENPDYDKVGLASWYGSAFHGRKTANGEIYDQYHLSAAHPTMPLPSYARVTNTDNGSSVIVRVNDRGPFHPGRIIDVSEETAELLDMKGTGTASVRVQYVGPARLDGRDMNYLMASWNGKGGRLPEVAPTGLPGAAPVMVASNDAAPTIDTTKDFPPAPTLDAPQAAPASAAAFAEAPEAPGATDMPNPFEQFALLPETGPDIVERPQRTADMDPGQGSTSHISAFAERADMPDTSAFDAILVGDVNLGRDERLTPETIRAFALKHKIAMN